ncbi:MAG: hypothetical protein NVS1B10_04950 [Candidatus Saccharimonadales bacterium]
MSNHENHDLDRDIEAINSGECLNLRGRAQCSIAAKALKHTGVNLETADDIIGSLKTHEFETKDYGGNEVGFSYYVVGDEDLLISVRSDIIFSLSIFSADPSIQREDYVAANALLEIMKEDSCK